MADRLHTRSVTTNVPLKMWIDDQPLEPMVLEGNTIFTGELAAGSHRMVLLLDARDLPDRFSLTSRAGTFATEEFIR